MDDLHPNHETGGLQETDAGGTGPNPSDASVTQRAGQTGDLLSPREQREIFYAALDLPSDQREEWVRGQCHDPTVIAELLNLMAAHDSAGEFLDATDGPDRKAIEDEEFPGFAVERLVGEGGHGEVFLAEEQGEIQRRVALKVIRCSSVAGTAMQRFHAERRLLARLDHPGIARIYQAGTSTAGRPFFAMEFVPGDPITAHSDERRLGLHARMQLLDEVCCAVSHAHQRGVIHGDLKPGNILVAQDRDRAFPRIIDFGIARSLEGSEAADRAATSPTPSLQPSGTPAYMAPEQADPRLGQVDTRTDVFGLGATLYELLTGEAPYRTGPGESHSLFLQRVRSGTIQPPSERISGLPDAKAHAVATQRGLRNARQLTGSLRGDLEQICMRALAADPDQRYPNVDAFCDDIRSWIAHRPIAARRRDNWYAFKLWVQRHTVASLVLVTLSSALLIVGGAWWQAHDRSLQAELERYRAEAQAKTADTAARETADFLIHLISSGDPSLNGPDLRVRDLLEVARQQVGEIDVQHPDVAAALHATFGRAFIGLGLTEDAIPEFEAALKLHRPDQDDRIQWDGIAAQLVGALLTTKRPDEAERWMARLRPRYHRLGPEHPRLARGISMRLASQEVLLLELQGQQTKALAECREILAWCEANAGGTDSHRSILMMATDLLLRADLVDEAESVMEQFRQIGDADNPRLDLLLTCQLANSLLARGKVHEARAMIEPALREAENHLGPDHPAIAAPLAVLARTVSHLHSAEMAFPLLKRAVNIRRQSGLRGGSYHTAVCNLAACLNEMGRYQQAREEMKETLRATVGDRSRLRLTVLKTMLRICRSESDLAGARVLAAEAQEIINTSELDLWMVDVEIAQLLSLVEVACGELGAAVERSQHAWEILQEKEGAVGRRALNAGRNHIALLHQAGHLEEAFTLACKSYNSCLEQLGPTDYFTIRLWAGMTKIHEDLDRPLEALVEHHNRHRDRLLELLPRCEDPAILSDAGGWLLRAPPVELQDPAGALPFLEKSWRLRPGNQATLERLVRALWATGQREESVAVMRAALEGVAENEGITNRKILRQMESLLMDGASGK